MANPLVPAKGKFIPKRKAAPSPNKAVGFGSLKPSPGVIPSGKKPNFGNSPI